MDIAYQVHIAGFEQSKLLDVDKYNEIEELRNQFVTDYPNVSIKSYNVPMNPDKIFGILSEPDTIKDRKLSEKKVHIKWEEDNLQLNSKRKLCWRFSEKKSSLENLQPSMA